MLKLNYALKYETAELRLFVQTVSHENSTSERATINEWLRFASEHLSRNAQTGKVAPRARKAKQENTK